MWEFVDRRVAPRHKTRLQCRLMFPSAETPAGTRWQPRPLVGYTRDISASGIAVIVADIGTAYGPLTEMSSRILAELELPSGKIEVEVSPARMERLEHGQEDAGFLLGLHIRKINESLRARFEQYLYALG